MPEIYTYDAGIGGVDFAALLTAHKRITTVQGGSGRNLEVTLSLQEICIQDSECEVFHLKADCDDHGTFYLSVRTRGDSDIFPFLINERHPDLYAAKFVKFAMDYFIDRGNTIKRCMGIWCSDSDNYKQFYAARTFLPPHEAAKRTWSGRQFMGMGFSRISSQDIEFNSDIPNDEIIYATFSKGN